MKVYIAGPLFNEMEQERNRRIRDLLENLGYETYLPQEDGGLAYEEIQSGRDVSDVRKELFERDVQEVRDADIFLALLDGRVPDEGLCVELGIAHALGKTCIGYRTDTRQLDVHGQNLMIDGCLDATISSLEEFQQVCSSLLELHR